LIAFHPLTSLSSFPRRRASSGLEVQRLSEALDPRVRGDNVGALLQIFETSP
jgi:hypothetical protein